ncbi:hypothetical protein JOM56_000524 [Amanita muscaria]
MEWYEDPRQKIKTPSVTRSTCMPHRPSLRSHQGRTPESGCVSLEKISESSNNSRPVRLGETAIPALKVSIQEPSILNCQLSDSSSDAPAYAVQGILDTGEGRVMILCFDDTGRCGANSTIARFFRALEKHDREKQIVYYQPRHSPESAPTTSVHAANTVASTIDEAFALHLDDHVKEGYQFIDLRIWFFQSIFSLRSFALTPSAAHMARVVAVSTIIHSGLTDLIVIVNGNVSAGLLTDDGAHICGEILGVE